MKQYTLFSFSKLAITEFNRCLRFASLFTPFLLANPHTKRHIVYKYAFRLFGLVFIVIYANRLYVTLQSAASSYTYLWTPKKKNENKLYKF